MKEIDDQYEKETIKEQHSQHKFKNWTPSEERVLRKPGKEVLKAVRWEQQQQMCLEVAWPEECSQWKRLDTVTLSLATWSPVAQAYLLWSFTPNLSTMKLLGASKPLQSDQNSKRQGRIGLCSQKRSVKKLAQLPSALPYSPVRPSLAGTWHSANDPSAPFAFFNSTPVVLLLVSSLLAETGRHSNCIACIRHCSLFTICS